MADTNTCAVSGCGRFGTLLFLIEVAGIRPSGATLKFCEGHKAEWEQLFTNARIESHLDALEQLASKAVEKASEREANLRQQIAELEKKNALLLGDVEAATQRANAFWRDAQRL